MAHMGRRYGDRFDALTYQAEMEEVARRDKLRIGRMEAGDTQGFWEMVQEQQDDLKWCGSSPLYTFLRAVPGAKAVLRHYQQWNIDRSGRGSGLLPEWLSPASPGQAFRVAGTSHRLAGVVPWRRR